MATEVTATVIGGLLKPDDALSFAENTRVKLRIEPIVEQPAPQAAWHSLLARLSARPIHGQGKRYSRDELHERARH